MSEWTRLRYCPACAHARARARVCEVCVCVWIVYARMRMRVYVHVCARLWLCTRAPFAAVWQEETNLSPTEGIRARASDNEQRLHRQPRGEVGDVM